jgi:ATP-dependent DNA helicase RecQ
MTVLFDRVGYKELRTAFMTYNHLLEPEPEPET